MTIERCRSVWLTGAVLVLGGCVTPWDRPDVRVDYSSELLSGVALFGEEVGSDEIPDADILELTDGMVSFVEDTLGKHRIAAVRFRRMFNGLAKEGYFDSTYQADTTNTAAETFHNKSGNCLSYTNMFIALARQAGLDARFQIVNVPPSWDADSGYLIRYTHINVLVKGIMYNRAYGDDFSVDFNDVLPEPEYDRYEISDNEALSLYYANRSVGLFRTGSHREAFALLKKAIEINPDNPDLWINLGAFYAKKMDYEHAIQAYQMTLKLEPDNRAAISGLGRAYDVVGEKELAQRYNNQVRRYRARNPYYHFAIAQAEYERARYEQALDAINTALDLKFRNGRFHFLKGLTLQKLGDTDDAATSFRRASRYGNFRDLKQRYSNEVADALPVS